MTRFSRLIERQLKRMKEEEEARCPCGYVFDTEDLVTFGLITYCGEEGQRECECPQCKQTLMVTEDVCRTYEVAAAKGEESR